MYIRIDMDILYVLLQANLEFDTFYAFHEEK